MEEQHPGKLGKLNDNEETDEETNGGAESHQLDFPCDFEPHKCPLCPKVYCSSLFYL